MAHLYIVVTSVKSAYCLHTWQPHGLQWQHCSVFQYPTIRRRSPQVEHRPMVTYASYKAQQLQYNSATKFHTL